MYLRSLPPPPPPPSRRRPPVQDRGLYALSAVSLGVIALLGLRTVELPQPRPVDEADRLRIELVHPAEPPIQPGGLIDVGELVDEFRGPPPAPPPAEPWGEWAWIADEGYDPSPDALTPSPLPPWRAFADALFGPAAPPPPPAVRSGDRRGFGFDAPRPDWRAERDARRARLDALDRRAERAEAVPDDPYTEYNAESDPRTGFGD